MKNMIFSFVIIILAIINITLRNKREKYNKGFFITSIIIIVVATIHLLSTLIKI